MGASRIRYLWVSRPADGEIVAVKPNPVSHQPSPGLQQGIKVHGVKTREREVELSCEKR
jgi:hypothetical protein